MNFSMSQVLSSMRYLQFAGVSNFVVNDELYGELSGLMRDMNDNLGADVNDSDCSNLSFRGGRILHKSEVSELLNSTKVNS